MKSAVMFAILGLSAALSNRGLLAQTPITDHTCVGHCGEQHSSGHCYCEADCVNFGDCCDDFNDVCTAETIFDPYADVDGANSETFSCAGQCHGEHKSGQCWCDEACTNAGDCCTDVTEVCFDDAWTKGGDDDVTIKSDDDMWSLEESLDFIQSVGKESMIGFNLPADALASFGSFEASAEASSFGSFEASSFEAEASSFGSFEASSFEASSFEGESAGSFLLMESVAAEAQTLSIKEQPSNAKVVTMVSGGAVVGVIAAVALMAYKRTKAAATPATPTAMSVDI